MNSSDIDLQILDSHHAADLFKLVNQNRHHLRPWFPWVDRMLTLEHFQGFVKASSQRMADGTELSYMIFYKGEMAGRIGIYYIDKQHNSGGIGYWLGNSFVGKGIVHHAVPMVLKTGFDLNLNRIEIKCAVNNSRSKAIAVKLNFKFEGILREAELNASTYNDLCVYSMLKSEFLKNLG